MSILNLKGIKRIYKKGENQVKALNGVDLNVEKGEFLAFVGPSGSGKTTALNIVGCLDSPSSGTILYNGEDLSAKKEKELSEYRRANIGFIFQSYNLIPVLTVRENIELPLVIERKYTKEQMEHLSGKIIKAVGLDGMEDRLPRELSGGQEQRVAVARALVKSPLVVLADEPTANLDSKTAEDIIALMKKINKEMDTTFIFSTHDPLMMKHARRVITLQDGKILKDDKKK